jgi:[ribosomal protein S18]-alanine N-acetyltransferase
MRNMQCDSVIRAVEPGDCAALARFFAENNRPEIIRQFHPFALSLEMARKITSGRLRDRFYVTAARPDAILGLCMLRGWDEGYKIPSFGVLVDHRHNGRGLGESMLNFACSEARKLGCDRVRISVNASNLRARGLYSLGFKEVSKEPVVIDGEADVKVVMMKYLGD